MIIHIQNMYAYTCLMSTFTRLNGRGGPRGHKITIRKKGAPTSAADQVRGYLSILYMYILIYQYYIYTDLSILYIY